uniref:Acetyltransferase, GNAT family protein n=1 Tax=Rhipicephalus appendiculatus TaxID=34631 RepID=A0A131Z1M9_RHIAP
MNRVEEAADMFDCCYRGLKAKESSDNVVSKRTFLMKGTGSKPSIGQLSAATVEHPTTEESEEKHQRNFVIRAMRPEELEAAYKIRLQTNYVFSKNTLETSWKMQPDSFLVAVSDDGEVFGTISMVKYSEDVVFLGLLVVREDMRHRRIGTELLKAGLEKAGTKNKFMRCILPLEPLFNRMNLFMVRSTVLLGRNEPVKVDASKMMVADTRGVSIKPFEKAFWDRLRKYDEVLMTVDRSQLLQAFMEEEGTLTDVALREDGSVAGYSVVQLMSDGSWYFYMLAADTQDLARMLIGSFLHRCPTANDKGLVLVSPLWPSDEESFLVRTLGWSVSKRSVCRFSDNELKFDYSRIFSM